MRRLPDLAQRLVRAIYGHPVKSTDKKEKAPVGYMQMKFTAGLSGKHKDDGGVFVNYPMIKETMAEAFLRRRRSARKEERVRHTLRARARLCAWLQK